MIGNFIGGFVVLFIGGKYKDDYEESLKEEPEKEHKQTYYEYVQERLAVEKEMRRR